LATPQKERKEGYSGCFCPPQPSFASVVTEGIYAPQNG